MVRSSGSSLAGLVLMLAAVSGGESFAVGPCVVKPLPPVPRGHLEVDFQTVPAPETPSTPAAAPTAAYEALPARVCQCRAAGVSSLANLLDREKQAVQQPGRSLCHRHAQQSDEQAALKEAILGNSALEVRNDTAGVALELYYRLAEAEGKAEVVQASLTEINDAIARTQELKDRGLKTPVDLEVLRRQRLDLQSDQTRLQLRIGQLNAELRPLLGLEVCGGDVRLWPALPWQTLPEPPDEELAVAEALAHRPELLLLRSVSQQLDAATLPVVRQLLQSLNGLLGMAPTPPACAALAKVATLLGCTSAATTAEVQVRRAQLDQYLHQREQAIRDTVRGDVRALPGQMELLALARQKAQNWQESVRDLEDQKERGVASYAEVSKARLEWLHARSEVIEEAAAVERALVKLKRDQGVLVLECDGAECDRTLHE